MSEIRAVVGTKKGAFILTWDGKERQNWKVSGPHFAGWEEIYQPQRLSR